MPCVHLSTCKRDKTRMLVQRGLTQLVAICLTRDETQTRINYPLCFLQVDPSQDRGVFFAEDTPDPLEASDRDEKEPEPEPGPEEEEDEDE